MERTDLPLALDNDAGPLLDSLQRATFAYFLDHRHPHTGLVADSSRPGSFASIAATGMGLSALVVGAARGWIARAEAARYVLGTLRFLHALPDGDTPASAVFHGFFSHFLDPATGRRWRHSEISTIDTALLLIGALSARQWFDGDESNERELRSLADDLYRRADWRWALGDRDTVAHGWRHGRGFLKARWEGYNEGILVLLLGLGSPTYTLPPESYAAWLRTYRRRRIYGIDCLYAGPLFIHQMPHCWIDFRGIHDETTRVRGIDYFENSRRATLIHREYARRNPRRFAAYDENCWGLSACDGPGPAVGSDGARRRRFWAYHARGAPFGPDDGTLAPWVTAAALPFAPEIVIPALLAMGRRFASKDVDPAEALLTAVNPTCVDDASCWRSGQRIGIDQGPVLFQIENYRSGLLWNVMRGCPYLAEGLRRAGFTTGGGPC